MKNHLRRTRENANCRLWQLSAESGVSASTLSAIERYGYKPRVSTMEKIATALGVSVQQIWPSTATEDVSKYDRGHCDASNE